MSASSRESYVRKISDHIYPVYILTVARFQNATQIIDSWTCFTVLSTGTNYKRFANSANQPKTVYSGSQVINIATAMLLLHKRLRCAGKCQQFTSCLSRITLFKVSLFITLICFQHKIFFIVMNDENTKGVGKICLLNLKA